MKIFQYFVVIWGLSHAPIVLATPGLKGEASGKGRDSTKIDFEETDISGSRKSPMGTMISQSKASTDYDFVKIRLRWHPEIIQSAASLDSSLSKKKGK